MNASMTPAPVALGDIVSAKGFTIKQTAMRFWPLLALALVISLWTYSLRGVDASRMTDFGFLSLLSPLSYLALAILVVSTFVLIYTRPSENALIVACFITFILLIHGTPNVLYGTLRYSWSWKHVGIVGYIQQYGSVNPTVSYNAVYHNWPGFFAFFALFTDLTGSGTALSFAGWAPVFFNLIDIGVLLFVFTSLTTDKRTIWYALLLFYLTNWVGQDYFSPQALNYSLHLIIIGIVLKWFRATEPPKLTALLRIPVIGWFAKNIVRVLRYAWDDDAPVGNSTRLERVICQGLIVVIFAVIVVSHQITPLMTLFTLFALLFFGQTRTHVLPVIIAFTFVGWLATGAHSYMSQKFTQILTDLTHLGEHFTSTIHNSSTFSPAQLFVSNMVRGLTLSVFVLAGLGALRRLREKHFDLLIVVCALAPFVVLAASSYGGEVLFRVYLFSLPFMSLLIAMLFRPSPQNVQRWRTEIAAVFVCAALFVGFLFAYYGKDRWYYFTPDEVAASDYLYYNAPPGALLIEGSRNYPSEYQNYERFTYVQLAQEIPINTRLANDTIATLARWMSDPRYSASFIIITRGQILEENGLGQIPAGTLENTRDELLNSPQFKVEYSNNDAIIFRLADKYDTP